MLQLPAMSRVPTDSLQALSGIRIALGTAIPAVPFTGKANSMTDFGTKRCKQGHPLTPINLYVHPTGQLRCRACRNIGNRLKLRQAAAAEGRVVRPPPSERTHCPQGHQFSGTNLVVKKSGMRGCRTCMREQWRRRNREGSITKTTVLRVFEALHAGKTINNITNGRIGNRRAPGMKILPLSRLQTFKRRYPQIGRRIDKLAARNRETARQQGIVTRRSFYCRPMSSDVGEIAFAAITMATTCLPDHIRDDVRSAMFLAVAEGRLNPRDAASSVRDFIAAHNRQYSKYVPHGGGIMQSLDQQVYDDGPTRLIDTVTHGLWD
jgi:hypothetical protein